MELLRKLFYRKPPDGLLEISERVFVFDCCFLPGTWKGENYKNHISSIVSQLKDHFPDSALLVFNFGEKESHAQMADIFSSYDITVMDYPRHYKGCQLLTIDLVQHFLRSSESWLSLGQHNVLLMYCEPGAWPVLAFMLAALMIYRKQYSGEQRTLDMVYRQAPMELLHLLSPMNPMPSQLRYLQYISRRNVALDWPPLDRALALDCIILRCIPSFDGDGGCRPMFRVYGQDPFHSTDQNAKVLFPTQKRSKAVRVYKQSECELVKIDIHCHIHGDIVVECVHLKDDMESEETVFRIMFNTAFIRSNILILSRDEVDMSWNARDCFSKDFRAEIIFSEMDAAASYVANHISCFEEEGLLPIEAFAKVQDIFSHVDWLSPRADATLPMLQQMSISNLGHENLDIDSHPIMQSSSLFWNKSSRRLQEEKQPQVLENDANRPQKISLPSSDQSGTPAVGIKCLLSDKEESISSSPEVLASPDSNTVILGAYKYDTERVSIEPVTPLLSPSSLRAPFGGSECGSPPSPTPSLHIHSWSALKPTQTSLITETEVYSSTKSGDALLSPQTPPKLTSLLWVSPPTPTPPPPPLPPATPSLKDHVVSGLVSSPPTPPSHPPHKASEPIISLPALSPMPPPPPPPYQQDGDRKSSFLSPPLLPPPPQPSGVAPPPPPPPQPSRAAPSPPPLPSKPFGSAPLQPPPTPLPSAQPSRVAPPPSPPPPQPSGVVAPPPPPYPSGAVPSPPPPPLQPSRAALSPLPLPPAQPSRVAPPPPPPPPQPSGAALPAPPPPISTVSSSIPCVPPPPAPLGNGVSKASGSPSSSSPGIPFGSPPTAKARGLSRTISSKSHITKKLKPLHWLKLTRAVQGSLWAETKKSGEAAKAPEIDMSELESLFSAAVPSSDKSKKSSVRGPVGTKPDKVQLIDLRRAYNCEIMLSKVKVPIHDLMSSVLALEDSAIDNDQVDNLIKFCPTKEEMELLKGYTGEKEKLGRCEQFFLELLQVPRVESKLRVFSFKMQFQSQVSDLRKSLNIVKSASEEIRNSSKLKRIMQTILSLGNALNQGTARGSAIGFRLDSLLKLTETRARNNRMTLMHYLCKMLSDKLPEVLDFSKDLESLKSASRIQLKPIAEEMQAISKGLEKIVQELSCSESDGPISDNFLKILKEFLSYAEAEVRSLASLYSSVGRNVDALIFYFGEDPACCPFEQVISTILNFERMFIRAHYENRKQLELEMKTSADSNGPKPKPKTNVSHKETA